MKSTWCECACSEFRPDTLHALENIQKIKSFRPPSARIDDSRSAMIGEYWRERILTPYSRRILTKSTDKLVALTAVASRLQSEYGFTYLAGLWKDDLIHELLWYVNLFGRIRNQPQTYQERFYAPSWSWVSVHAPMSWRPFRGNDGMHVPLAQVLEAFTSPSTLNPFGPVSDGHIKISALRWHITVACDGADGRWTITKTETAGLSSGNIFSSELELDTRLHVTTVTDGMTQMEHSIARRLRHGEREEDRKSELTLPAIPLIVSWYSIRDYPSIDGLILQDSVTRAGCFERLGRFKISARMNPVEIGTVARQEIVII